METECNARRSGRTGGARTHTAWNNARGNDAVRDRQGGSLVLIVAVQTLVGRVSSAAAKHIAFCSEPAGLVQIGAIFADRAAVIRAITEAVR